MQKFTFTRSELTTQLTALVEREVEYCSDPLNPSVEVTKSFAYDHAETAIRTAYYLALALGYFTTPDPRGTCESMIQDALLRCRRAYVNGQKV